MDEALQKQRAAERAAKEKELVEKYPTIMRDYGGDMTKTCMAFGICIGSGWLQLLDDLCAKIMALPGGEAVVADQIKEKFGGLRFYWHSQANDKLDAEAVSKLVDEAERQSTKTCEHCGTTENVTHGGKRWVRALCDAHRVLYDGEPDAE